MKYRPELDGLRALALLPVILFHAGFQAISGGFVGVDVFFVISGYLITAIIVHELQHDTFSFAHFYERRARRILPALFLVMGVSSVFACAWMLPDELENYGQSVLATALFSNNLLLYLTSSYWALASEFKPLLHTWSLGVEEQFYLLFPVLLLLIWRSKPGGANLRRMLGVLAILSLIGAHWGATRSATASFYLLPTRAWELLLGSLLSIPVPSGSNRVKPLVGEAPGLMGLVLIALPIFLLDRNSPGSWALVPAVGAALLIRFATEGTLACRLLSNGVLVTAGLISYSAYLWHQPLFAFARIYAKYPPTTPVMAALSALALGLGYVSWRFVETPFRNPAQVSRKVILVAGITLSFAFSAFGYYLHATHGVPARLYDANTASSSDMYISYNGRAFSYRKDRFDGGSRLRVLVVGNSFARDFVNMTLETFDMKRVELVYRDDLRQCVLATKIKPLEGLPLYEAADVIVFASGNAEYACLRDDIEFARTKGKALFYVGTKNFGQNLNWLVRLPKDGRANQFNPLPQQTAQAEKRMAARVPEGNYLSLLASVINAGQVPVTDEKGRLLSPDRSHLTRHGAIYLGRRALLSSPFGQIMAQNRVH